MPAVDSVRLPELAQRLDARRRPTRGIVGTQRWNHLLFAHWAVSPAAIQATLPPGLFVDTYEGQAYLGVVPFFMERVRPKGLPPLPWLSWFLELNVRTYVHDAAGRPGVWFYSLDCNQPVAVALARRFFHLPYYHAEMTAVTTGETVDYRCRRRDRPGPAQRYVWRTSGEAFETTAGSLEFFLVERYRLFSSDSAGQLFVGQVNHAPYRISTPKVSQFSPEPARLAGFELRGEPVSLLAAPAVEVSVYALQRLGAHSSL